MPPSTRKPLALLLLLVALVSSLSSGLAAFCLPNANPSCWPSRPSISQFATTLSNDGEVVNPDRAADRATAESITSNLLKTGNPGIVVLPGNEADLVKAIKFARTNNIRVVARCSGHDYNGRSTGRGVMMLKTERIDDASYNEGSQQLSFGAGASFGKIYNTLKPYGRVFPGAGSSHLCPAGCLASGCHGPLSRLYGLGSESVVEIRLALYNGTLVTASRTSHPELFHAYLGAGQNAFAIATRFVVRTYPMPAALMTMGVEFSLFHPSFPNRANRNILTDFFMNLAWFDEVPRGLSGWIQLKGQSVTAKFTYAGEDPVEAYNALQSLLESRYLIDLHPVDNFGSMADYAAANTPLSSDTWQRKFVVNGLLPHDQAVLDYLTEEVVSAKPYLWLWMNYGGAVRSGTVGSVHPAVRNAVYEAIIGMQWNDPRDDLPNMDYVQQFLEVLYGNTEGSYNGDWTTWGNVYNVPADWKSRLYGDYDRLLEAKMRYDPCNVITSRLAVGFDMPQGSC